VEAVDVRVGCGSGDCAAQATEFVHPSSLALLPGLGLVRDGGRVQVFATPDVVTMASMSVARVGWMVAVAQGVAARARIHTE
jgi:hypothetical protein